MTETATERRLIDEMIECHDGWKLHLYWATGYEHDVHGIDGIEITRGQGMAIHVPTEDIPTLIEALQRTLEREAVRTELTVEPPNVQRASDDDESERMTTMATTTVRHHATCTGSDGQVLHVWIDDHHELHIGPTLGGWAAITIPVCDSGELANAIGGAWGGACLRHWSAHEWIRKDGSDARW